MLDTNNSNQIQDPNTAIHLLHIGKHKDRDGVSLVWSKLEIITPVKLPSKETIKRSDLSLVKSSNRLLVKMNDGGEEFYQEQH